MNLINNLFGRFSNLSLDILLCSIPLLILFGLTRKIKYKKKGTEFYLNDK
jgi:hypothetical protein